MFFSSSGGEFMALLSVYHIIQTTRKLFTIAPHKHIADHQIFDHKWLLWKFITDSAQFVIHLLSLSYFKCFGISANVQNQTQESEEANHPHQTLEWKRSQAIPDKEISICENLFASIWKRREEEFNITEITLSL